MASSLASHNDVLPRSHSSPNIPDSYSFEQKHTPAAVKTDGFSRSASYSTLPVFESLYTSDKKDCSPVDQVITTPSNNTKSLDSEPAEIIVLPDTIPQDEKSIPERVGRRQSLVVRPKSWIQKVKGSPERKISLEQKTLGATPPVPIINYEKSRLSESFASFARKSWINSSRSPSPNRIKKETDDSTIEEDDSTTASSVSSSSPRKGFSVPSKLGSTVPVSSSTKSLVRRGFLKKSKPNEVFSGSVNASTISLSTSIAERHIPSIPSSDTVSVAKVFTKERLASVGGESTRRKDELWSAFRSLETDFQKFTAKSSALRTNVVRSTLQPFLRNYAAHPSNKNLRPEDLDRRVIVLNKWWTGLLDMLDGSSGNAVSGVDRPVLLDAMTGIMTRPEWRLAPSYFAPLTDRSSDWPLPRSISSSSLNSTSSQFLAESVYHNVRNIFIQNLLSQMNLVVEKMSLRQAPASLVTFCGKAVAYAYFFCPGVADVLVRLWRTPFESIKRVADEFGLERRMNRTNITDEVVSEFPPSLHSLGWSSPKLLFNHLRQTPNPPPGIAIASWSGPWVARWCGRDSDLFFVFCKHYHILVEDFLPHDAPLTEKARAPGFVLVHAQILTALNATIHRQPGLETSGTSSTLTFEELLSGADASAVAMPLPPSSNVARLMAENRLIMLLRDFLSDRPSEFENARHTFAEAFSAMMSASAKKISLYDHNSCFILCDFLEEALPIFMRFHRAHILERDYIDWPFWLDVCRKIMQSQNSMSEIRLISFIYGSWTTVTQDDGRKKALCLNWLLSEDVFQQYFMHWCPMVRAYYMRLLCWRVCRYDGEASALDTQVLSIVLERLKLVWSHYLYLKQDAASEKKLTPSSSPCHPAPGRRLLIIRNDTQIPTSNLFLNFDGILSPSHSASQATAYRRHSAMPDLATEFSVPDAPATSRKKWSILGKIMPFNGTDGPVRPRSAMVTTTNSRLDEARHVTAAATPRSRPSLAAQHKPSSSQSSDSSDPATPNPSFRSYSFKFSLEWNQQSPQQKSLFSRNRKLILPRLPSPAQTWLVAEVLGTADDVPSLKPVGTQVSTARYAGRALAEWAIMVTECNNFTDRRRAEGVPNLKLLEVPTLGVEGFRKTS